MKQHSSIDESNAAYFGLPIERMAEHNRLMTCNNFQDLLSTAIIHTQRLAEMEMREAGARRYKR